MTEQSQETKRRAGSIKQYATLGKGKASERSDVQTSENQGSQELKRLDARESEEAKRPNVQESEHPGVRTPKRERHTIYLPPELSEWLKIRAIKTKREISEVATEALEHYKSEVE